MIGEKQNVWLTNDFVFKHIFKNKKLTKDFLKEFFKLIDSEVTVKNVKYSMVQAPLTSDKLKVHDYYLDIVATLQDNTKVDLEMYNKFGLFEYLKSCSYATRLYSQQLKKGEDYLNLKKVISINIVKNFYDDNFVNANSNTINEYGFINVLNCTNLSDKTIFLYIVRLDKLNEIVYSKDISRGIKWLKFINANNKKDASKIVKGDEILMEAYESAKNYLDDPNLIEPSCGLEWREQAAEYRGTVIGRKEGMREGKQERTFEIAKNMIENNFKPDSIHIVTGLPISKIRSLMR